MMEPTLTTLGPQEKLDSMIRVLQAQRETDPLALSANATAIMAAYLDDINWIGFYILRGNELVLGPFQGKAACSRIQLGEGVCGACAREGKALLVPDVSAFAGHIACDSASRSEVVVPVFYEGEVIAVLDCDSPRLQRFTAAEAKALEQAASLLAESLRALQAVGKPGA